MKALIALNLVSILSFSNTSQAMPCESSEQAAVCKSLMGKMFNYSREMVFHGEYEIDACQLTVTSNLGQRLYTEFRGEFWPTESQCSDLKMNENKQFKIAPFGNTQIRCYQLSNSGAILSVAIDSFCNL